MSAISSNYSGNALAQTASNMDSFAEDAKRLEKCQKTICAYRASMSEKIDAYEQFLQISDKFSKTDQDTKIFQNMKGLLQNELSKITVCIPTEAPPRAYDKHAPKYAHSVDDVGVGFKTYNECIGITNPNTGEYITALDLANAKASNSKETFSASWKSWDPMQDSEKKKIKNTSGATLSATCGGDGSADWHTFAVTFTVDAAIKYCVPRQLPKVNGTEDVASSPEFFQDETTYTLDLISLLK